MTDVVSFEAVICSADTVVPSRLDRGPIAVFPDTVVALDRWQRGGLPLAILTDDDDDRNALDAAGPLPWFGAVVDRSRYDPETVARAATRLGVEPAHCVLLENSPQGIAAGSAAGCGLVVGVNRRGDDHAAALHGAGAHAIVSDVATLRFPRRIPAVNDRRDQFATLRRDRPLCVFLDFDGTLSPIVDDPDAAAIDDPMRQAVRDLADRHTVAVVSGRDRADVEARVRLEDLYYAGSHGLDIAGPGGEMTLPEAEATVAAIEEADAFLRETVGDLAGAVIERKRYSVAAHYRMVAPAFADRVKEAATSALARTAGLRAREGKMVVELVPDIDWDKGRAVDWLLEALAIDTTATFVVSIGDDETDEDTFRALAGRGLGIHVGPEIGDSLADFRLADPDRVGSFLRELTALR